MVMYIRTCTNKEQYNHQQTVKIEYSALNMTLNMHLNTISYAEIRYE